MLFVQTSAPTGWTKDTDHNDKALRIVSGAAASGGSSPFSTVFGKTATDGYALTIAEMPSHAHNTVWNTSGVVQIQAGADYSLGNNTTSSVGGGAAHAHGMDIRVQYVDVIKATKD
jgi:hypothetical protein